MSENQKKILQMLAEGKISVDEAQRLIALINDVGGDNGVDNGAPGLKKQPRYLRVIVEPKPDAVHHGFRNEGHKKVNIRIPLSLMRAGMKFASLMPSETADHVDRAFKDKGISIDVKHIKDQDLQDIISALGDSVIDVDTENELVKIYAE